MLKSYIGKLAIPITCIYNFYLKVLSLDINLVRMNKLHVKLKSRKSKFKNQIKYGL